MNHLDWNTLSDREMLLLVAQQSHEMKSNDIPAIKQCLGDIEKSMLESKLGLNALETKVDLYTMTNSNSSLLKSSKAKIVTGLGGSTLLGILLYLIVGMGKVNGWW